MLKCFKGNIVHTFPLYQKAILTAVVSVCKCFVVMLVVVKVREVDVWPAGYSSENLKGKTRVMIGLTSINSFTSL